MVILSSDAPTESKSQLRIVNGDGMFAANGRIE